MGKPPDRIGWAGRLPRGRVYIGPLLPAFATLFAPAYATAGEATLARDIHFDH